jgi:uncharacterized protein with HEPN domain
MPDRSLILDGLRNIEESLEHILERTAWIRTIDDFVKSSTGVDMLDVTAIRLMAVGEEVKKIDKRTDGEFLPLYPQIDWKGVMGFRDVIAHGYFHIDAAVVFDTLQNNVRPLLDTTRQMISDLER